MKPFIYIVDDEAIVLDALRKDLSRELEGDYELEYFQSLESTREALSELRRDKGRLALIIMDLSMPDGSGLDFLASMGADFPHAAKILLTGSMDFEKIIDAFNEMRLDKYVIKPWNRIILVDTVREVLARKKDPA